MAKIIDIGYANLFREHRTTFKWPGFVFYIFTIGSQLIFTYSSAYGHIL